MDRHEDWAVIICLVGGGQEIHKGESGIGTWFDALTQYPNWNIFVSENLSDEEFLGTKFLDKMKRKNIFINNNLHLDVDLRSFRTEKLSKFVKALLDNDKINAKSLYSELKKTYSLVMTRDLKVAKQWVINQSRGNERYGLIASSEGKRLRAEGIWVPSSINHVSWFLDGKEKTDSSYYLEVVASEFKIQGLEIDYALLAWDADFRYENNSFKYHKLGVGRKKGSIESISRWNNVNKEIERKYLKNAYRVLLTRARQGLIIFISKGNNDDPTTLCSYYDGTYNYFKEIGIDEI